MLPTANDIKTPRATINPDSMSILDLDSLMGELNQPKEVILPTPGPGMPGGEPGAPNAPGMEGGEVAAITAEEAARTGERIATTVNTVFGFGASMFAKSPERKDYEADRVDVGQLSKCWADVAMKHSFKIEDSPWLNLIILTAVIYAPIFLKAKQDRIQAIFREEMQAMKDEQERVNARLMANIAEVTAAKKEAA